MANNKPSGVSSQKKPATAARPKTGQASPGVKVPGRIENNSPKAATATPARPASRASTSTGTTRQRQAAPPPDSNKTGLLVAAGVGLIVIVGIAVFLLLSGSSSNASNSSNSNSTKAGAEIPVGADAAAQIETFPDQGRDHLAQGQTVENVLNGQGYNSNPPTSGPHLPTWSKWGVFNTPLSNELQVHNLEHGGVIIQYDCPDGCTGAVNTLSNFARRYPPDNFTGVLLAPRSNLPNGARIALTAWTHRLLLKSLDTDKVSQFIATYIGKGPEGDPTFRP
ncbi:MAG TPA: DUF3105 domain-containing protein [Chloroflexia bacterium]|nr:DUF3105 domain-containing protein [Chloroflexia bacterium]